MKRVLLLVAVASMLAVTMALSGVAQAAPRGGKADAQRAAKEAIQTLGPSYDLSRYPASVVDVSSPAHYYSFIPSSPDDDDVGYWVATYLDNLHV
jgi:hypothetical protein